MRVEGPSSSCCCSPASLGPLLLAILELLVQLFLTLYRIGIELVVAHRNAHDFINGHGRHQFRLGSLVITDETGETSNQDILGRRFDADVLLVNEELFKGLFQVGESRRTKVLDVGAYAEALALEDGRDLAKPDAEAAFPHHLGLGRLETEVATETARHLLEARGNGSDAKERCPRGGIGHELHRVDFGVGLYGLLDRGGDAERREIHFDHTRVAREQIGEDTEFLWEVDDGRRGQGDDFTAHGIRQHTVHQVGAVVLFAGRAVRRIVLGGRPRLVLVKEFHIAVVDGTHEVVDFVNDDGRPVELAQPGVGICKGRKGRRCCDCDCAFVSLCSRSSRSRRSSRRSSRSRSRPFRRPLARHRPQLGLCDTVVIDEFELGTQVLEDLLLNLLRLFLRERRIVGGFQRVGQPPALALANGGQGDAEDFQEELGLGGGSPERGNGHPRPVIVGAEHVRTAFHHNFLLVAGGQGCRRQNVDGLLPGRIESLHRGDGGTGLARAEAVVDEDATIRRVALDVIADEFLILEGTLLGGAGLFEVGAGVGIGDGGGRWQFVKGTEGLDDELGKGFAVHWNKGLGLDLDFVLGHNGGEGVGDALVGRLEGHTRFDGLYTRFQNLVVALLFGLFWVSWDS